MASKDFQVRHGLIVNTDLIVANTVTSRIGINNQDPQYTLDVSGDTRITGNLVLGDSSTDTVTLNGSTISLGNNQSFDSGTLFVDATNNRVGVGTSSPQSNLDVSGSLQVSSSNVIADFRDANSTSIVKISDTENPFQIFDANGNTLFQFSETSVTGDILTIYDGNSVPILYISNTGSITGTTITATVNLVSNTANINTISSNVTVSGTITSNTITSSNITVSGTLNALEVSTARLSVGADLQWDSGTDTYTNNSTLSSVTNIHLNMKRCVVNSAGVVQYYLNSANSELKADGTSADLSGADGQVMVEVPKFYYRYDRTANTNTWAISETPLAGYQIHPAFIKAGVEVPFRYVGAYDASLNFTRSITAVANAGGGDIEITTSEQHPLYANDTVTISGTTSYDGDYIVVSRPSGTTFNVTATYVATETGTATGYVSGKNLDDMTSNIVTANDSLASVSGHYPLVGVTRDECRSLAESNGTGWHQLDFALWSALQMLYLVEYGTFDSQTELGDGNTNGSYLASSSSQSDSPHTIAGASNSWGNASTDDTQPSAGAKPGTAYMSYRGVENIFGNCWNWVDGINVNQGTAGTVYYTNDYTDFADNTTTNYTEIATSFSTGSGYTSDILSDFGFGFLSSSNSGGSSSTYLTDYHYASASLGRVVAVGGFAVSGALAGLFYVNSASGGSDANRSFGARLAF